MEPRKPAAGYEDRLGGLVAFGIIEILMGLGACVMGLLIFFVSATLMKDQAAPPKAGILLYLVIGALLIWLGIGALLARRWARALNLIFGWFWLVVGLVAGATLLFTLPSMLDHMGQSLPGSGESRFVKWFTLVFVGLFSLVFYVLIPGAMVLFYRSPHVKATCEARDPKTRWTDRCPLPLLALSLMYGFGVLFLLIFMPAYGFIFPFFGTLLSGAPGALAVGVTALLVAYSSIGFYRLQSLAWWVALGISLVGFASSFVTFSQIGLLEIYQRMGFPAQQIEAIRKTGLLDSNFILVQLSLSAVLTVGYLLWARKFLKRSEVPPAKP
jgi:hypothetical protein